ncbi:deoxynucleoside kinase [Candidatus Woesearchaeota archaeon]|nr:deoxynucleoside kinase [Candidatus Woesearchaeota archaeon]
MLKNVIIELTGLPRSGKSTIVKNAQLSGSFVIHEEFFDENSYSRSDHNNYNLWYAEQLANRIKIALKDGNNHVFHRGAFDRIAFAQALFEMGFINKNTLEKQENLLNNLIQSTDKIILCDCSVDESLKRDRDSQAITGNRQFLEILCTKYENLAKIHGAIKVNTNGDVNVAAKELRKILG